MKKYFIIFNINQENRTHLQKKLSIRKNNKRL